MGRTMGASDFHRAPFHPYGKFPTVFIYRVDVVEAVGRGQVSQQVLKVLLFN